MAPRTKLWVDQHVGPEKCKQIIAADHSVRHITLSESEIRGGKLEENVYIII